METNLTKEELNEITLGWNWSKDMSYEDFLKENPDVNTVESFDLFQRIELNYLTYIYENDI